MKSVMSIRGLMATSLLLALGALPSCGENEPLQSKPVAVVKEDIGQKAREAYNATKTYTLEQTQAFRKQTESRLGDYKKEIDRLQANSEKLEGDAKAKAQQQLTALLQKRDDVSEKLKNLSSSSGNTWAKMKSGVEAAMYDLGRACKKAVGEFSNS
jgi:hypothetical protein